MGILEPTHIAGGFASEDLHPEAREWLRERCIEAPGEEKRVDEAAKDDLHPCLIFIDKEGRWYHKGVEMIHRDYIRLFFDHMELDQQGRYVIAWQGDRCYVDVEDTAYVVQSVRRNKTGHDGPNSFTISLSDDSREALTAETLFLGEANVPYCKVKNGAFPARFNRAAYYQLAEYIQEDNGAYYLSCQGKKHEIL
ncbi:MAG: DUF1285 domain-containing protein [Deltaproteobacteria bacterium]|nr:DUF1285 domain-containing protein [Deltaproteobacteria bacterium]